MNEKFIRTQEDFDRIENVQADETVVVECSVRVNSIIKVFGKIILYQSTDCSFAENRYFCAYGSSSVEAYGSSSVIAYGSSSVKAHNGSFVEAYNRSSFEAYNGSSVIAYDGSYVIANGSSSVISYDISSVIAYDRSSVISHGSSSVLAHGSSSVIAYDGSYVIANGSSSVLAHGSSSVIAYDRSSVIAHDYVVVRLFSKVRRIILDGYSVCVIPQSLKMKIKVKSKKAYIHKISPINFFERNKLGKRKKYVLYKRVSKDFKTQENTPNETVWKIGGIVKHENYKPDIDECGEGKFHACSKPHFCDEFRSAKGDRYIAVEVKREDLFEWKDSPVFPHKISFRCGKVLYECDRFGKKIES